MKLHWWIAGVVVVAAGGVLIMKHFAESKEKSFHLIDNSNKMNYTKPPAEVYEPEFEGTELLI